MKDGKSPAEADPKGVRGMESERGMAAPVSQSSASTDATLAGDRIRNAGSPGAAGLSPGCSDARGGRGADRDALEKRLRCLLEDVYHGSCSECITIKTHCNDDDGWCDVRVHRSVIKATCPNLLEGVAASRGEAVLQVDGCSKGTLSAFVEFLYLGDISSERLAGARGGELEILAQTYDVFELTQWLGGGTTNGGSSTAEAPLCSLPLDAAQSLSLHPEKGWNQAVEKKGHYEVKSEEGEKSSSSPRRLVMAVDMGSSSVRAMVFVVEDTGTIVPCPRLDGKGQVVGVCKVNMNSDNTFSAATYLNAAKDAIDQAAQLLNAMREDVISVGISCLSMTLVGLDAEGKPITPVYTYADTRGGKCIPRLREELEGREGGINDVYTRTGVPLHTSYAPALLTALHFGEEFKFCDVASWTTLSAFILSDLTGVRQPITYSEASWTGMFNSQKLVWDVELVGALNLDHRTLPGVCDADQPHEAGLVPELAAKWGSLAASLWTRGVGDGAAANLGAGCTGMNRVCVTIGTSAAVRVCIPSSAASAACANPPKGLWRYAVDGSNMLLGGAVTDGGNAYAWAMHLFGGDDVSAVEAEASSMSAGAHGLTVLPFFSGERSPGYRAGAEATITGITLRTSKAAFLRAVMEAVALRLAAIFNLIRAHIAEEGILICASGAALCASPLWQQILADCIGHAITVVPSASEASCFGAAMLAARAAGISVKAPGIEGKIVAPTSQGQAAMSAALERQESLYGNVYGIPKTLAESLQST